MTRAERASLEAADWLIAQADGTLSGEDQARFDAWLEASDANKAAYWRLEFGWEEAGRASVLGHGVQEARPERALRARLSRWVPLALAASVAIAFGVFQLSGNWTAAPEAPARGEMVTRSHVTSLGENHIVGLSDGSRIQLNTQSKLRTRITTAARDVWLDEGEAFFEVAHQEGRPFVVHAGDRQIRVLGTQFSVRRSGTQVVVAVLEGRVELIEMEGAHPVRSSIISGGDIALAAGGATLVTARSEESVEQALSWREGVLAFEQEPLSAIAAEFNRYNARKLVLEDPGVGAIRISGTFPSDKPDAFARLLREAYGLEVADSGQDIRINP